MFNKVHHYYFSRESCLPFIIVYILCFNQLASTIDVNDVVFVILSQPDNYHSTIAEHLRQDILGQVSSIQNSSCNIRLVHEEFPHLGAWTVTPLLPWLHEVHGSNSLWVLFLQERTQVNIKILLTALKQYETEQEIWMGHLLHDEESTIIHHFAFSDNPSRFKYPLFTSGFVMSMDLIKGLALKNTNKNINKDFSIDAAHEFALYVGKPLLNASDIFCLKKSSNCATYPADINTCGKPVPNENIFFAVKTCRKFHEERIPIIKKTWGKRAKNIEFFSHYQDKNIPTTDVGVENTERGHCTKMFAIFRLVLERATLLPDLQWLLLADDDTLLSVPRLQELLACWNSSEPMVVGERYGYNVLDSKSGGYNYITGGGGIAITVTALPSILQHCSCYQNDAPDDMYLGICLARLNIPMIHSPNFHQARPNDYSAGYLAAHKPVSFHKHWMINPLKIYKKWFEQADNIHRHTEL